MTDPAIATGGQQERLQASVNRAGAFLAGQARTRTPYQASSVIPDDPALTRKSAGAWTGRYTLPADPQMRPYTPLLITGPLHFPIVPQKSVTFSGVVDLPFVSLNGVVGVHLLPDVERPGQFVPDPGTLFADGGANWGSFFVIGSVGGVTQFVTRVAANATFAASMSAPPAGSWSFQLASYPTAADAFSDSNRILVGHPWLEAERPGDVRRYYGAPYKPAPALFTGVTLETNGDASVIRGTLGDFAPVASCSYRILVTAEKDVEYAWALAEAKSGAFTIARPYRFDGKIKLRLVEQKNGCAQRVVGTVWAEENAAVDAAWPDLRIEYRAITAAIPAAPSTIVPARRDGTWSVDLSPPGIGRVSLVDVNTRRVYGEYTMPSGLLRSYNVAAADAGQSENEVYSDDFNNACFLYDQAVALIAFLQLGERQAAAAMVDALLTMQDPDGRFPFACHQAVLSEHNAGYVRTGAVAWVAYALLLADRPAFRDWFATPTTAAARRCLAFLAGYLNPVGLLNGGKGRYVGNLLEADYVVPWWSTEHNIDGWWCFDLAAELYGDADYRRIADGIRRGLETAGWRADKGIFWQGGTYADGRSTPDGKHALDVMSWGGVLLHRWGRAGNTAVAVARMNALYHVVDSQTGLSGFTTFLPIDGYPPGTVLTPWYEGSFGVVCVLRRLDPERANDTLAALIAAQNPDGSYPYAVRGDVLNGIQTFPCLIAAAWNVLAFAGPGTPNREVLWQ